MGSLIGDTRGAGSITGVRGMVRGRTLTLYKAAIEELGLRQLDVYRVKEVDKDAKQEKLVDVIRIFDPASNKVVLVKLPAIREAVSPKEYIEILLKSLKDNGISYPERKAAQLVEVFTEITESEKEEAES